MIYLDYQATTPVDPRVLKEMMPYLTSEFGNAASVQHSAGRTAADAAAHARQRVAASIGARANEIVFTSGATEANNLAIAGFAAQSAGIGHIISAPTEHPSVLEPLAELERQGWPVSYIDVSAR